MVIVGTHLVAVLLECTSVRPPSVSSDAINSLCQAYVNSSSHSALPPQHIEALQ